MTRFPIYLLRHGQTEWNRDDRRQGRLDSPLTDKGLAQGAAMGRTVARLLAPSPALTGTLSHRERGNWRFVSSPQPRAFRTAEIVGEACGLSPIADERLMEVAMGSWEGLTWPEIDAIAPGTSARKLDYPQFHVPDGEPFADTVARATDWLAAIDRPTIAVSHGLFGLVLRARYLGLDEDGLRTLKTQRQNVILLLDGGNISEVECE